MSLTTVFQVSIYTLVILAGLTLAYAEGAPFPQLLTAPLALVALFVTERWKKFQLSPAVANGLGILAFAAAALEFLSGDILSRLISGAHLLVYLTWITLFQPKQSRQYWWLCALAMLQIAVASVLTKSGVFGVLLVAFVVHSLWTLSVFSLYQARLRYASLEQFAVAANGPDPVAPVSHDVAHASVARGSVHLDPNENWINTWFVVGTLVVSLLTIAMGGVFFALIPHVRIGPHRFDNSALPGARTMTGFTEEVQLGDMGQILESTEPVMTVRVFDLDREARGEDARIDVADVSVQLGMGEPLFRGNVLDKYVAGRWTRQSGRFSAIWPLPGTARPRSRFRQEIELQPIGTKFLFAMHPIDAMRVDHKEHTEASSTAFSETIVRDSEILSTEELHYEVFVPRRDTAGAPQTFDYSRVPWIHDQHKRYLANLLNYPRDRMRRLSALAREKSQGDDGSPPRSDLIAATRLESYLGSSGEFRYSLDASIQDDRIDPVEDFLFNRKTGHCEYFASAMALMLRAIGIPSRLVSGFKGGQKNTLTGDYVVEQRHAHAWVEAWIDDRWVTFDPTPPARAESVADMNSGIQGWRDVSQVLQEFWLRNVVSIDGSRQRQLVYQPLQEKARNALASLRDLGGLAKRLWRIFTATISSPERWFSWQGGLISFVLLLILSGIVWLLRTIWGLVRRRTRSQESVRTVPRVAFYERFTKALSARGFVRVQSQTQREFAGEIQQQLQTRLALSGVVDLPVDVARLFYQVRFGGRDLSPGEAAEIDAELSRFESCLAEVAEDAESPVT